MHHMSARSDFAIGLRDLAKSAYLNATRWLGDEAAVRLDHYRGLGRRLDLKAPRRFSDKIQHYKLAMRDPRMPPLVDKLAVKSFVRQTLGEDWIIPTIWSGVRVTEFDLCTMPAHSVIKPSHASGKIAFIDAAPDLAVLARRANNWLKWDHHLMHREWAYAGAARRLLVEPQIAPPDALTDYKFWIFDGEVRLIQVDANRFTRHTRSFFTDAWRPVDVKLKYPRDREPPAAPARLDAMLDAALKLAGDFRFVRVDLYDTPERALFGEMTFWPEAGLCGFDPPSFDLMLGETWTYPAPPPQRLAGAYSSPSRSSSSTLMVSTWPSSSSTETVPTNSSCT